MAAAGDATQRRSTPLPWLHVTVLASVNLINSVSYLCTYPFTPFLVMSLMPRLSERETGFYSGTLEGAFHVGAFLASLPWGWLSDTHGRRPCLLAGLAGTMLCSVLFGLSSSYEMALGAKFLWGALNSTVGISKTALAELTDDSNAPRAFSLIGVATGFGRLIGPAIGGLLSEPASKYPALFDNAFWRAYPYLLPCIINAAMSAATLIIAAATLPETLQRPDAVPTVAVKREEAAQEGEEVNLVVRDVAGRGDVTPAPASSLHVDFDGSHTPHAGADIIRHSTSSARALAELPPLPPPVLPVRSRRSSSITSVDTDVMETAALHRSVSQARGGEDEEGGVEMVSLPTRRAGASSTVAAAKQAEALVPGGTSCARWVCSGVCAMLTCGGSIQLMRDRAVAVSTLLYTMMGLVGIIVSECFPLYVLNDAAHGGFSWTSTDIGLIATMCGPPLIVYQALLYDRLHKAWGLIPLVRGSMAITAVLIAVTPLCSLTVSMSAAVQWTVLAVHFIISTLARVTAFTCIFVLVANSALPADRGKVNGLGQALASAVRAVGPAAGTALFAWSVSDTNTRWGWPLDYHFMWYLLSLCAVMCVWMTYSLPHWIVSKREADATYGTA